MTDHQRPSMTLVSPPSADIEAELVTAASETNTLYVLEDDVLMIPGMGDQDFTANFAALEKIERHLGVAMIAVVDGLDRPWVIRKGTPLPAPIEGDQA